MEGFTFAIKPSKVRKVSVRPALKQRDRKNEYTRKKKHKNKEEM